MERQKKQTSYLYVRLCAGRFIALLLRLVDHLIDLIDLTDLVRRFLSLITRLCDHSHLRRIFGVLPDQRAVLMCCCGVGCGVV